MSATMDVDHFSQYFNQAPVLYLEGRQYPVKVSRQLIMIDSYTHMTHCHLERMISQMSECCFTVPLI